MMKVLHNNVMMTVEWDSKYHDRCVLTLSYLGQHPEPWVDRLEYVDYAPKTWFQMAEELLDELAEFNDEPCDDGFYDKCCETSRWAFEDMLIKLTSGHEVTVDMEE